MYNHIKTLVKQGKNLFITGGAGVGKSYTLEKLKKDFPKLVITAPTGLSAVNVGGETIHAWSGAQLFDTEINKQAMIIRRRKDKFEIIKSTTLLAIDEISMLSSAQLDYLNELFQILRKNRKPFGGIQLLLFGDLFQMPPVNKNEIKIIGGKEEKIQYCFKANCWKDLNLEIIKLEKVYRQNDIEFIKILNNIREGKKENLELLLKRNNIEPTEDVTRLYTVNSKVKYWNNLQYNKIDGEEVSYWANDTFYKGQKSVNPWDDNSKLTPDQIKTRDGFNKNCNAERCLKLKEGARVILLQNIDVSLGLCNGSCGYVTDLESNAVVVKFDNGVEIPIKKWPFHLKKNGKILIERKQIPLMLAYSLTFHRAQGMGIEKLFIDFDKTFEDGQAYVALSRATNLDTLYLKNFSANKILVDKEVIEFYNSLKKEKVLIE